MHPQFLALIVLAIFASLGSSMSLFPQRLSRLPPQAGKALGAIVEFEIPRDFPIEGFLLRFVYSTTGTAQVLNADGQFAVAKKIQLAASDGARNRNVVDSSGAALIELFKMEGGQLDRNTLAAVGTNGVASFQFTVPIFFPPPNLDDPIRSTMLLPTTGYNSNPKLVVTLGSQADVDTGGAPTYAIASGVTVTCTVIKRQVNILKWKYIDCDLLETSKVYASNLTYDPTDLPVPGCILGVLARMYTSVSARGDISNGGLMGIQILNTDIRKGEFKDLQVINDYSVGHSQGAAATNFGGLVFIDFMSDFIGMSAGDFGSVLDVNPSQLAGSKAQFCTDVVGGAGVKLNLLTRRVYAKSKDLTLGR